MIQAGVDRDVSALIRDLDRQLQETAKADAAEQRRRRAQQKTAEQQAADQAFDQRAQKILAGITAGHLRNAMAIGASTPFVSVSLSEASEALESLTSLYGQLEDFEAEGARNAAAKARSPRPLSASIAVAMPVLENRIPRDYFERLKNLQSTLRLAEHVRTNPNKQLAARGAYNLLVGSTDLARTLTALKNKTPLPSAAEPLSAADWRALLPVLADFMPDRRAKTPRGKPTRPGRSLP
jgi:hypothetical protein